MRSLKKYWLFAISLCLSAIVASQTGYAVASFSDRFVAASACDSAQNTTNPGNIRLSSQQNYPAIGKERENASRLVDEGYKQSNDWVSGGCRQLLGSSRAANSDYILALNWQPSFCETKPALPECRSQTSQSFEASHLVLHGLWLKNSDYCNVSPKIAALDRQGKWSQLPPINLSRKTRSALALKMPGVASSLHLHEWYKHGRCYSNSPEEYYQESLALLDRVNNSAVRDLFARNIGKFVSAGQIRDRFDKAFDRGAGSKVQVRCQRDIDGDRNDMVVELQINLKGNIQVNTPIANLLKTSRSVRAGCSRGEIDPAGFD